MIVRLGTQWIGRNIHSCGRGAVIMLIKGTIWCLKFRFYANGQNEVRTLSPDCSIIEFKVLSMRLLLSIVSASPISFTSSATVIGRNGSRTSTSKSTVCHVNQSSLWQSRWIKLTSTHSRRAIAAVRRTTVSVPTSRSCKRWTSISHILGSFGV